MKRIYLMTSLLCIVFFTSRTSFSQSLEHPTVGNVRLGVALYSFHKQPFEQAIKQAGETGVQYVEGFSFSNMGPGFGNKQMIDATDGEIAMVRKLLKQNGVKMVSMYVANGKDARDWKRIFDQGKKFGVTYFVCEPETKHLDSIDSLAGIYGIRIAIHQHAKGESAYWHPDSVLAAIKGHRHIGACGDIGHWVRSGLDPVACIKSLAGHIIGLHMKDINQAKEDVDPGTGAIAFEPLFRELKHQKFAGYAQIECEHNMTDNLKEVKSAFKYYRKMIGKH